VIYLKQSFDIEPAAPSTRDRLVETMNERVLPANEHLGARLVGAWFAHEEWFSQVIHVTEFDDLAALGAYRDAAAEDAKAREGVAQLAELAPVQRIELVEPLGPIAVSKLHEAIAASADEPVGTYTFAILEVAGGRMDEFSALLGGAADQLPIIACWNDLTGSPNRVIDLWKGDVGRGGYRPNDPGQEAFFGPLRKIAPQEKMMRLHAMPYSPLR
jgi:hypothetical protein